MSYTLWTRSAIYAVALWLVSFLVTAVLSALGLAGSSLVAGIILALVTLFTAWSLGARLSLISISQGIGVALIWAALNVLLDGLVIVLGFNGGNPSFFFLWTVWGRYLLLLVIPLLLASRRRST